MIPAAKHEFEQMEDMLVALESYLLPYPWGSYKIVVLPPSFPYGGMENPLLTFISPAIMTGDRSLTNVLIHEIAHSWTGNLVSCKNWSSFWLNEGFTVFLERKGVAILSGEETAKLAAYVGLQGLNDSINSYEKDSNFTSLTPQLKGRNPDDAFSLVPYEKGFLFVTYLESLIGDEYFQDYMRNFIKDFWYKSIDSADFKQHFINYVRTKIDSPEEVLEAIDWNTWLTKPGLPPWLGHGTSGLAKEAIRFANQFLDGSIPPNKERWVDFSVQQKIIFFNTLLQNKQKLTAKVLHVIFETNPQFLLPRNAEIFTPWMRLCIATNYSERFPEMRTFLKYFGRFKYIRPIYKELVEAGRLDMAKEFFEEFKDHYHKIAVELIQHDIEKAISLQTPKQEEKREEL
eukprot:TRINITY_DN3820_c0_g2_i1.p1 TRINITY_DN3820_c0_g2~~TRINITY_DN3820_c0_g2_i1.p1  ORF type:complete len:401 (+),score=81.26 TRINITY_DN3820_c0_g2_i1:410-1612(+)